MTRPAAEQYVATFMDTGDNLGRLAAMLEEAAEQRRKVGITAAGELAAEKATGVDIRAGAVKVLGVLADADLAGRYAEQLRTYLASPPAAPPQPAMPPPSAPQPHAASILAGVTVLPDVVIPPPAAASVGGEGGLTPAAAGRPPADRTVTPPAGPGVPTEDQTRLQWMAPGVDDPVVDNPYQPDLAEPEPGDVIT